MGHKQKTLHMCKRMYTIYKIHNIYLLILNLYAIELFGMMFRSQLMIAFSHHSLIINIQLVSVSYKHDGEHSKKESTLFQPVTQPNHSASGFPDV